MQVAIVWVAGTHLLNAFHCRDGGADLDRDEMRLLFDGINATALAWPEDLFVAADEAF